MAYGKLTDIQHPTTSDPLLDRFLSPKQRSSIRLPIQDALTLPRQAFTSDAFFDLETERLFSQNWLALCFTGQLPEPGCLMPMEILGLPILVVHGSDNRLRVFHNIVPYDGCLAAIDPQNHAESIITPYHGWRYDLTGKLLEIPYWDGNQAAELSALHGRSGDLVEIRSACDLGILFIDLSGNSGSFNAHIKPLKTLLSGYKPDLAIGRDETGAALFDQEHLATNWKTHYENWAINVLHENFTHEIYAGSTQIPRVNENAQKTYHEHIDGGLMALAYFEQDFAQTYELDEVPFTHLGIDPNTLPERSFIGSLFPNLHMAVFPYFIHFIISIPVQAGVTKTTRAQFYEAATAANPEFLEDRLAIMADFQQAGQEDGRITEAVQKARRSPAFEQQFYSPFWDNMHYEFTNRVLSALEQNIN